MASKKITVKLVKSPIGRQPKHRATVAGLGLKRLHQSVQVEDNASTRGMIKSVEYLLEVSE